MLSPFVFVHLSLGVAMQNDLYGLAVGATLACGTGACAVVVAAVLEGRAERVCVSFLFLFLIFTH
jgi:diaminopimelate epimerase